MELVLKLSLTVERIMHGNMNQPPLIKCCSYFIAINIFVVLFRYVLIIMQSRIKYFLTLTALWSQEI